MNNNFNEKLHDFLCNCAFKYNCSQKFKYTHHEHECHGNIGLSMTSQSCFLFWGRKIVQHTYLTENKQENGHCGQTVFGHFGAGASFLDGSLLVHGNVKLAVLQTAFSSYFFQTLAKWLHLPITCTYVQLFELMIFESAFVQKWLQETFLTCVNLPSSYPDRH